jgi:hypothetical protein
MVNRLNRTYRFLFLQNRQNHPTSKHRKNVTRWRSGDILVGFRENLVNHVQILENECEFVLWVKVDGKVFNLKQPIIFGTIYIYTTRIY